MNIKDHLSDREYQQVELITIKGVSALPGIGDVVLFSEIYSGQVVLHGVLEPFNLGINAKDILLHRGNILPNGQTTQYFIKSRISLNDNNEITLEKGDTDMSGNFNPTQRIILDQNGAVRLSV